MTALDRLLAAIDDDGPISRDDQLDLVNDLLRRRHRPERGRLTSNRVGHPQSPTSDAQPVPPAEQIVWTCRNCLRDWREPYCDECGATLNVRRTS